MTDPRLASRNAAILTVAIGTVVTYIAWMAVNLMLSKYPKLAELKTWVIAAGLACYGMLTLLVVAFR